MQPHQATCARQLRRRRSHRCSGCLHPGPSPALRPCHRLSSRNQLPANSLRAAECIQCRVPQGAPWLWRTSGLQQQRHIRRASWTTYVDVNAFDHVPWSMEAGMAHEGSHLQAGAAGSTAYGPGAAAARAQVATCLGCAAAVLRSSEPIGHSPTHEGRHSSAGAEHRLCSRRYDSRGPGPSQP